VESKGATEEAGDRITGEWQSGTRIALTRGPMLGNRMHGDSLDLFLLAPGSTRTANGTLVARIAGDTVFALVRQTGPTSTPEGPVRYVRANK
jgi:hypothetical protein